MNILAIGDIVGNSGVDYASAKIKKVCGEHNIDFVIANGNKLYFVPIVAEWKRQAEAEAEQ